MEGLQPILEQLQLAVWQIYMIYMIVYILYYYWWWAGKVKDFQKNKTKFPERPSPAPT